jgi:hypothetical protein
MDTTFLANEDEKNDYNINSTTLYTVPKAPAPIIPPLFSSDSFVNLNIAMSGSTPEGCSGTVCRCKTIMQHSGPASQYQFNRICCGNIKHRYV